MNFLFEVFGGLIDLPWWGYVLVGLGFTHVTIAGVTIFLHRYQAHRALELHPAVSHFFRFWLWLTTGMVTKEWAAVHRKHHAKWLVRSGDGCKRLKTLASASICRNNSMFLSSGRN